MSVADRPLYHPNNRFVQASGVPGYRCCDGRSPRPLDQHYTMDHPSRRPAMRALLIRDGRDPDELWCGKCATALELLRDDVAASADFIGGLLKMAAPIVGMFPGIGTGFAVAMSAAGALASGDALIDGLASTVSSAIPGGVPRIAFDAGADVARAAVRGEDVGAAAIRSLRSASHAVGGDRASTAFDTALAVGRGEPVDAATLRMVRLEVTNGGPAAEAAFDAGYALATGADSAKTVLAISRGFVARTGNTALAIAFDGGTALAMGEDLQAAGFAVLKHFVAGSTLGERALEYADKIARALRDGRDVADVLRADLLTDVQRYAPLGPVIGKELAPLIAKIQANLSLLTAGSYALAQAFGVDEAIARAAQAACRDLLNGGSVDLPLVEALSTSHMERMLAAQALGSETLSLRPLSAVTSPVLQQLSAQARGSLTLSPLSATAPILSSMVLRAPAAPTTADRVAAYRAGLASAAAPPPLVRAPVVVAAAPPASSSVVGDVALGGGVAAALLAIAWWARS